MPDAYVCLYSIPTYSVCRYKILSTFRVPSRRLGFLFLFAASHGNATPLLPIPNAPKVTKNCFFSPPQLFFFSLSFSFPFPFFFFFLYLTLKN